MKLVAVLTLFTLTACAVPDPNLQDHLMAECEFAQDHYNQNLDPEFLADCEYYGWES